MTTRRKTWDVGNIFAIPLGDGTFGVGHVVGREAEVLNSVTVALYRTRLAGGELSGRTSVPPLDDLLAVQFTTKDLLTRRIWKVLANVPVDLPGNLFPYEDTRANGWVGAKMIGSGILVRFLRSYHGLDCWDQMHDPDYFDKLLVTKECRPARPRLKGAS